MKKISILLLMILVVPSVMAVNLNVQKLNADEVLIVDLNQSINFYLRVTNFGEDDSFEFYNLLGFLMYPSETVPIAQGETKDVSVSIFPIGEFNQRGSYTFTYYIQGRDKSQAQKEITFRVIDLKDAFEIGAGKIDPESNSITVYVHNKVNYNFENINAKLSSSFFNIDESFSLGPNQRKEFTINLNKEEFKELMAGFYTLDTEIEVEGKKTNIESTIQFLEKDVIKTEEEDYGFVVSTKLIKKTNEGNVIAESETNIQKNIISRLFTDFNPEPDVVERKGYVVDYTWNREIKPGETLEIKVKTNWFIPFLVIAFVLVIVIFAKRYSMTNLVLKKKVTFVRAKGGEFALKVSVFVTARKYVEKISVIDRLPPLVKIHERFGGEQPKRVNEKNKTIEWGFEKLEAGETRLLSYIIYSKVGVVGKFALPQAKAIYEREGDIHESKSNRAFFLAEQKQFKEE